MKTEESIDSILTSFDAWYHGDLADRPPVTVFHVPAPVQEFDGPDPGHVWQLGERSIMEQYPARFRAVVVTWSSSFILRANAPEGR